MVRAGLRVDAGRGLGITEGDSQDGPSEDRQDARRGEKAALVEGQEDTRGLQTD